MELPWHQCFSYQRCRSVVNFWSRCSQQKPKLNWNGGDVLYVCRWGGESVWRQCFHEETTVPHNHCSTQRPSSCFTGVYSCNVPTGSLPPLLPHSPTRWPIHQSIWFSQSCASVKLIHFTLLNPVSFHFHIHSHKTLDAADNHHHHHNKCICIAPNLYVRLMRSAPDRATFTQDFVWTELLLLFEAC